MPKTLSDEEWAYLQRQDQVARFADGLYNNPKVSNELKRLIKTAHPDVAIQDYDAQEQLKQQIEADKKERAEEKKKAKEDAEKAEWQQRRDEAKEKYHMTDDAMERLEKMMIERHIGNYDDAAELMIAREPKTSEPTQEL